MRAQTAYDAKAMPPATDQTIGQIYKPDLKTGLPIPLFSYGVSAGFPSPAEDYIERNLDLNELIIANPAATFFVRVSGESMTGAGINHDDIVVVDRSVTPASGRIVIAVLNGELTIKRLIKNQQTCALRAEHPDFPPVHIPEDTDLEIWGVVTFAIHKL